jgi:hypothetical protein
MAADGVFVGLAARSDFFHVWRMDREQNAIRLYVDSTLLNTTDLKDTVNADPAGTSSASPITCC